TVVRGINGTISSIQANDAVVFFTDQRGYYAGGGPMDIGAFQTQFLPNTLAVQAFTPTAAGFVVQFNQTFDAVPLHLYDTQANPLGTPDVTIVGAVVGLVRGSLLPDAADNRVTFVATSGLLPPDTYTVTLRSATDGFHSLTAGLLDGQYNGTPGGDYITTFQTTSPTGVVVTVPSFTRGPNQVVHLPATDPNAG